MFRKMRRYKQELELPECIDILKKEVRGVLSVIGDDGLLSACMTKDSVMKANGRLI